MLAAHTVLFDNQLLIAQGGRVGAEVDDLLLAIAGQGQQGLCWQTAAKAVVGRPGGGRIISAYPGRLALIEGLCASGIDCLVYRGHAALGAQVGAIAEAAGKAFERQVA